LLRKIAGQAATLGAVLAFLLQSLRAAYLSGAWSDAFDLRMQRLAWESNAALAAVLQGVGCGAIAWAMRSEKKRFAILGVVSVLSSFTATGHTAGNGLRGMLAPVLVAHVGIAAFWLGALPALLLASDREPDNGAHIVRAFSNHAMRIVPLLLLAGVGLAWVLLPNLAAFATPYGWLLLAKFNGFWLLIALAARNQLHWLPRLGGGGAAIRAGFCRTVGVEYALALLVVVATAVMTTLFSPEM
jgi:copper resistance protein D